jgi:hypothetical protein
MPDNPLGQVSAGLDSAKVAGLFVVGALLLLGGLRRGFGTVRVKLGD